MVEVLDLVVGFDLGSVALYLDGEGGSRLDHRGRRIQNIEDCAIEIRANVIGDGSWLRNEAEARQKVVR